VFFLLDTPLPASTYNEMFSVQTKTIFVATVNGQVVLFAEFKAPFDFWGPSESDSQFMKLFMTFPFAKQLFCRNLQQNGGHFHSNCCCPIKENLFRFWFYYTSKLTTQRWPRGT
jgi:hypothetical protein